jgi:hypothetical protein
MQAADASQVVNGPLFQEGKPNHQVKIEMFMCSATFIKLFFIGLN